MSLKQKAIKGIIWSGIQNWGSQAGSLIVFFVLARLLLPADFGLVALANTFLIFFDIFVDQGFSLALIQRHEIEVEHLDTAFWTQICLGLSFTIFGLVSANLIAEIFQQPLLTPILQWFSTLAFLRSLSIVQQAILRRKFEFKKIAIRALLGILVSGSVGITLALLDFGVWSLVGQQLTFEVVGVIAFWSLSDWRPRLRVSTRHLKDLSGFGISIFFSNILKFFNQNSDNLLIGYFLGEVALGYYAVAYRILQVLTQLLVHTGNQVAMPMLSRLQGDSERFIKGFYKLMKLANVVTLPIFLGVIALAAELVITVFGEKWEASIPVIQILSIGGIIHLILFFNRSVFVAIGKPFWRLRLEILNVSLNIAACMLAVRWGIVAVAFAYILSDLLVVPASLLVLRQLTALSLRVYFKQLSSPLVCAVLMMVLTWLAEYGLAQILEPKIVLLICTLLGAMLYTICLRLLAPALFQELWELVVIGFLKRREKPS
ncbi:MAG: lipopolysaccharide biosynthesis protein [Cyanobacteria bacterium J06639_14]